MDLKTGLDFQWNDTIINTSKTPLLSWDGLGRPSVRRTDGMVTVSRVRRVGGRGRGGRVLFQEAGVR